MVNSHGGRQETSVYFELDFDSWFVFCLLDLLLLSVAYFTFCASLFLDSGVGKLAFAFHLLLENTKKLLLLTNA